MTGLQVKSDPAFASITGQGHAGSIGRARAGSTEFHVAFEERLQELTVLGSVSGGIALSAADRARFDYELKNYHAVDVDAVAKILASDVTSGLTTVAAAAALKTHGRNMLSPPAEWPLPAKFIFSMFSGFAPLLWAAVIVCFVCWANLSGGLPALVLAVVLSVINFLGGIFVFWQEYQTARVLAGFKSMIPSVAQVTRNGGPVSIPASDLTVGDLVHLTAGCKVPADVRIVSAHVLRVDNSMLTGESEPVRLVCESQPHVHSTLEARNMAFMGTAVTEGGGSAIVVAVGDLCQIGRIAAMSSSSGKVTSLQADLNRFVAIVGLFALFFFVLVLIVWGAWLKPDHASFMSLSAALLNAMGVLIALIPEGLPLGLAAGLTVIAKRLCDKHFVLLKKLETVETLGSMSMLASDKTGTLTQNVMTVVNVVLGSSAEVSPITRLSLARPDSVSAESPLNSALARLVRGAILCNDASFEPAAVVGAPPNVVGGNGTDKALLSWSLSLGGATELPGWLCRLRVPFSSVTKQALAVHSDNTHGASTVFVKGAPDFLLPRCTSFADDSASSGVTPLDAPTRAAVAAALESLGRQGQRVLALCERPLRHADFPPGFAFSADPELNFPVDDLILVGLVAIADPPRASTAPAVRALRDAGIRLVMVTGDAETTAEAIARQVGIVTLEAVHRPQRDLWGGSAPEAKAANTRAPLSFDRPSAVDVIVPAASSVAAASPSSAAVVVTGPELSRFSAPDWEWLLRHPEIVLARTTPEQKLEFVKAAQAARHRVGVTGDGMNDAPALKNADVGVAMNSGSDAARDAAHVVLLKDDFAAIVHAVREGRLIFANLRKICAYLITGGCWSELLPVLATFFFGIPTPLSAFLMIFISCTTDVCASIALVYEDPEGAIVQGAMRDHRSTNLVDVGLVLNQYLYTGLMISFATFFNFFLYMNERSGPGGPVAAVSTSDTSGTVFSYPPKTLVFAWGWGTPDEVVAISVGSTIFFITIVVCQLANYMTVRRRYSPYFSDFVPGRTAVDTLRALALYLTPSWPILLTFIGELGLAVIISEVPGAQATFSTASVPGRYWGVAIGFAFAIFAVTEAGKWWLHAYPKSRLRVLYWK